MPTEDTTPTSAPMGGFSDLEVLWRWVVPSDRYSSKDRGYGDICDEYAVVRVKSPTGIMLIGRHGDRWVANPSGRAVIVEFLESKCGVAL